MPRVNYYLLRYVAFLRSWFKVHSTETKAIIGTRGLVYGNPIAGKLGRACTNKGSHLPSLLSKVMSFTELKNSTELVPRFLHPLKRVVSLRWFL